MPLAGGAATKISKTEISQTDHDDGVSGWDLSAAQTVVYSVATDGGYQYFQASVDTAEGALAVSGTVPVRYDSYTRWTALGQEAFYLAPSASNSDELMLLRRLSLFADGFESGDVSRWSSSVP